MKNFFKKLALVMALALVVTALAPAAGVFAASKPALNAKSKTLLLNEEDRTSFDFNIKNKVDGSTYKWTTSNAKVAKVNAKNGVVDAVAVGSATIKVVITLPTKKTTTLSAKVTVKENINTLTISNAPEGALAINEAFDFNRSYTTVTGGKTTDITRWEVISENKATASINDKGVFVATAAGEYEIVAKSFQSKAKYAEYLAAKNTVTATSKSVKVTVANTVQSVKQFDLASVVFTFGSEITKEQFDATNVHINQVIGDVKIREQKIKSVTVGADKKTVVVALYDPFITEATYAVEYPGMEDVAFKSARIHADDVEAIEFKSDEKVTITEGKTLEVNLFNKDGVIINQPSSTATELINSRVTYELVNNNYLSNLTNDKLSIYTKNEVATVTATFHTYKYNGFVEETKKVTKTFVGVEKSADTAKEIKVWTITSGNVDWTKKANQLIAVGDANRKLYVKLLLADGKTEYTNAADPENKIKLTSSNSAILFVDQLGNLEALKDGKVTITVQYNDVFVGSFEVVVNPKRVVTALVLDKTNANLSNATNLGDSLTVKAELVDQYGEIIVNSADLQVNATLVHGNANAPRVSYDKNKVTFNAEGAAKGSYQFKITHPGSATLARHVSILVQEPEGGAVTWRLEMKNEYDMKVTKVANIEDDVHEIKLFGYDKNGVKVTKESVGSGFSVKVVDSENKVYNNVDNNFKVDLVTVSGTSVSGSPIAVKAKTGNYTVTAYKADGTPVASGAFKVVDTQVAPTMKVKKFATNASTKAAAVSEAFTFDLNDNNKNVTPSYIDSTGFSVSNRIHVNYVHIDEAIGNYVIIHKLVVNHFVEVAPNFIY